MNWDQALRIVVLYLDYLILLLFRPAEPLESQASRKGNNSH